MVDLDKAGLLRVRAQSNIHSSLFPMLWDPSQLGLRDTKKEA